MEWGPSRWGGNKERKHEGPGTADLDGAEGRGEVPVASGSDRRLPGWEEGRSVHVRAYACVSTHVPTCAYVGTWWWGVLIWKPKCTVLAGLLVDEQYSSREAVRGPGHKGECCLGNAGRYWDLCGVAMEPQEKSRLGNDCWVQLHLEGARITPLAEYQVGVSVHNEPLFFEALQEICFQGFMNHFAADLKKKKYQYTSLRGGSLQLIFSERRT